MAKWVVGIGGMARVSGDGFFWEHLANSYRLYMLGLCISCMSKSSPPVAPAAGAG